MRVLGSSASPLSKYLAITTEGKVLCRTNTKNEMIANLICRLTYPSERVLDQAKEARDVASLKNLAPLVYGSLWCVPPFLSTVHPQRGQLVVLWLHILDTATAMEGRQRELDDNNQYQSKLSAIWKGFKEAPAAFVSNAAAVSKSLCSVPAQVFSNLCWGQPVVSPYASCTTCFHILDILWNVILWHVYKES